MVASLKHTWPKIGNTFQDAETLAQGKDPERVLAAARDKLKTEKQNGNRNGQASALLASAIGYLAMSAFEKALAVIWDVRRLLREMGDSVEEAAILLLIANVHLANGDAESAITAANEGLAGCLAEGDRRLKLLLRKCMLAACIKLSRSEDAVRIGLSAIDVASDLSEKGIQAELCTLTAKAFASKSGNAVIAQDHAEKAIALSKSIGHTVTEALVLQGCAEVELMLGKGTTCLHASIEAHDLFTTLGDEAGRARCLLVAAQAHQLLKDVDAGLRSAREALKLARNANDQECVRVAQGMCAALRTKPKVESEPKAPRTIPSQRARHCSEGTIPSQQWVSCARILGGSESKQLAGLVAVVSGASRGVGKGTALMLAEAGATVYSTSESTAGQQTESPVTVAEVAAASSKLGGVGVAVNANNKKEDEHRAIVDVIATNHGRLDILVHAASGSREAETLAFTPCLRRGKGAVIDVIAPHTASNGAVADQMQLDACLQEADVHVISMAPGTVKSERSAVMADQSGAILSDLETTRFTGRAVTQIARLSPCDVANTVYKSKGKVATASLVRFELDGYMREPGVQTFAYQR